MPTTSSQRSAFTVPEGDMSTPDWACGMRNLDREHGFEPLAVEGTIPAEIEGTLYRNVPATFDQFGERAQHWFDPDAAICAVRVRGGRADGAVKLVETRGMIRERRAGKRLYGRFGAPMVSAFREVLLRDRRNPAGTSLLSYAGRLYATCEAGVPVELDPTTLATLGESRLDGAIVHAFSAHTHHVPSRKAAYNIGVNLGRNTVVTAYELPDGGRARRLAQVTIEGAVTLHDFVVTEKHLVIPVPPYRLEMKEILLRRKAVADAATWRPELGTELIVIPLDEPARVTRFTIPADHVEHVINAYEHGSSIIFDATRYPTVEARDRYLRGETLGSSQGRSFRVS